MKGGDILEIEFSDDTLEEAKLTAQLFSRVINLEAKGGKELAPPGEKTLKSHGQSLPSQ